ncbi:hypothetical protein Leryth_012436 [Lithospermum erythrorhizon]|nr:hypothetical protein Leryth_012436 [Lithospermum erythrorhizon]
MEVLIREEAVEAPREVVAKEVRLRELAGEEVMQKIVVIKSTRIVIHHQATRIMKITKALLLMTLLMSVLIISAGAFAFPSGSSRGGSYGRGGFGGGSRSKGGGGGVGGGRGWVPYYRGNGGRGHHANHACDNNCHHSSSNKIVVPYFAMFFLHVVYAML